MKKTIASFIAAMALAAVAETTPVMVSLVTPVQAPSSSFDVTGFRLSLIYGQCQEFTGLDIGIVNHAKGDFTGLAVGGVNIDDGRLLGAQVGLINWNSKQTEGWDDRSTGLQLGLINYASSFCGVQGGILCVTGKSLDGAQDGYVNFAKNVRGAQVGYVNVSSGVVTGCQVGLLNYTDTMECGLQVGIINIISNNGWFPVLPIVNGHF